MQFKFELCTENAQRTRLMYKNVQTIPEIANFNMTLLLLYVATRKSFENRKRQRISFRPQRWHVPHQNHQACCQKLWFVRSLYPNLPQMGQMIYHGMLIPLHDTMPSFMNFGRVLDLLEFKNQVSQCLWPSYGGRVFDIHSHFLHGT